MRERVVLGSLLRCGMEEHSEREESCYVEPRGMGISEWLFLSTGVRGSLWRHRELWVSITCW